MEYWQLMSLIEHKICRIYQMNELEGSVHWTMMIGCEDKVYYVGMDFEKVEMVFKELE